MCFYDERKESFFFFVCAKKKKGPPFSKPLSAICVLTHDRDDLRKNRSGVTAHINTQQRIQVDDSYQ